MCGYREVKSVEESFRPSHNMAGNIMSLQDEFACVEMYVPYFDSSVL